MPMTATELIMEMQVRRKGSTLRQLCSWREKCMAQKYHTVYLNDVEAVSTIAIDFRADGEVLASTHGDHTVRLTCMHTGRVLNVLEGHSRTPWTVKFSPVDGDILASGCIGYEVRVWSASKGVCLNMVVLDGVVTSLSFNTSPSLHCIAVSSSTRVYLWQYTLRNPPVVIKEHKHTVRCVAFPPLRPDLLIVGVDNESKARAGTRLCQLTVWHFNPTHLDFGDPSLHTLTCPRILFRDVLLHNGLSIAASKCGRYVCGCAMIPNTVPVPMNVSSEVQGVDCYNQLKSNDALAEEVSSDTTTTATTATSTRTYLWPKRLSRMQGTKKCLSSTMQLDSLVDLPQPKRRRLHAHWYKEDHNADEETESVASGSGGDSTPHLAIALIDSPESSSSPEMEKSIQVPVISSVNLERYDIRGIHSISFSPSGEFVMMGCGPVDDNTLELQRSLLQPVTSVYRTTNPMNLVGIKEVGMDNINVACFSPVSGLSSVYGTRSGRLRIDQV